MDDQTKRQDVTKRGGDAAASLKLAGTFAGFRLGAMMALPIIPGMLAFGLAVAATPARKGMGFIDHLLMNLFVYAGMSQLVALDAWPERFGAATVASLAILCAIINARLLLMSATLQPWLGGLPRWQIYPSLHLLTDPGWLIAMRYRADGGSDVGIYYGSSIVLFLTWIAAIVAGYLMGGLVADPSRFGIDLVMPIFFAAMLVPLWRGARRGIAWLVAGAVSLVVYYALGGWWFVVAGAIAGSVAGGFLDDAE